jgi:glutathione S-transferase
MIELHYWPTPKGHKITMFLEEAELDHAIHPVDISAGDQFKRADRRRPKGGLMGELPYEEDAEETNVRRTS